MKQPTTRDVLQVMKADCREFPARLRESAGLFLSDVVEEKGFKGSFLNTATIIYRIPEISQRRKVWALSYSEYVGRILGGVAVLHQVHWYLHNILKDYSELGQLHMQYALPVVVGNGLYLTALWVLDAKERAYNR
ncbi:MAG: hypothetical protein ABIG95_00605 [Candidatus Woesearchaeota archaeon]